jgi:hypothetical protein
MTMRWLVLTLMLLCACKEKSKPQRVDVPEIAKGDAVGALAPSGAKIERVPPPKQLAWTRPTRAPNDQEQVLAGTWVATVGDHATRSLFMADRVAFSLDPSAKGDDLVTSVMKALENDNQLSSNCIWLELRADFTGFRRECMLVNGVASAMDQNDVMTGAKSDLGTALEWFIDEDDKNAIKIHFADDMVVPAPGPDGLRQLVFRHWTLRIGAKADGDNRFTILESIPEHDYALPTQYVYEIASGSYLD